MRGIVTGCWPRSGGAFLLHRCSNVCCQGQSRRTRGMAGESVVSHKQTHGYRQHQRNVADRDAGGESRPQHQILTLALPKEVEHWSLTTLREKLVKIGAKVVSHGRYVTFQLAEVAVPREGTVSENPEPDR